MPQTTPSTPAQLTASCSLAGSSPAEPNAAPVPGLPTQAALSPHCDPCPTPIQASPPTAPPVLGSPLGATPVLPSPCQSPWSPMCGSLHTHVHVYVHLCPFVSICGAVSGTCDSAGAHECGYIGAVPQDAPCTVIWFFSGGFLQRRGICHGPVRRNPQERPQCLPRAPLCPFCTALPPSHPSPFFLHFPLSGQ